MKGIKRLFTLILSLMMILSGIQFVSAEDENTMQIILEDTTDSADTLTGEAKVKVSVKGIDGSLTLSQLHFEFSGDGSFKSISYADEINELAASAGSEPFYIQPVEAKKANRDGEFFVAFSGGRKYLVPVSASGTELCTIVFEGEPEKEITLAINDIENSSCVVAPHILSPKLNLKEPVSITVKTSKTENKGVTATVNVKLDELKESGGFQNPEDITLKLTNTATGQTRTISLADAEKTDAVSYKFEISSLVAGNYDIALSGDGFVTKTAKNVSLQSSKTVTLTSDNFYAGDINADAKLTLLDYNRLVSIYADKIDTYSVVDFNRDEKLSQYDLLAMITSAGNHIENGQRGNIPAALHARASASGVKKGDTFTVTLTLDAGEESVNAYYITGSYSADIASLESFACAETAAENKAVNEAADGKFRFLNRVSNGGSKEIYTLRFKALKQGTFKLSFDNAEGALAYDLQGDAEDLLLDITSNPVSVTVDAAGTSGGGGGGGGGGSSGGGGGGGTTPTNPTTPDTPDTSGEKHKAYVTGYEDNTAKPDRNITRAEAAAMISRISGDFDSAGAYEVSAFTDVPVGEWYTANVGYAVEKGIVRGYEDGSFRPDAFITREEFATMVCRFMGYELNAEEGFGDVPGDHWAAAYIAAMKKNGIIGGYEDGSFGIGRNIVRAEVITMLNRAQGRAPSDEKVAAYIAAHGYPMTDIEGHWACGQIIEAVCEHTIAVLHG